MLALDKGLPFRALESIALARFDLLRLRFVDKSQENDQLSHEYWQMR